MSFFVPRKVVKPSKPGTSKSHVISSSRHATVPKVNVNLNVLKDTKSPSSADEKALARAAQLALSDYALFKDGQLRQIVSESDESFIPLSYLLRHSTVFQHLPTLSTVSTLATAIRRYASATLEVRMSMAEPSKAAWRSLNIREGDEGGGYEVRRVDLGAVLSGPDIVTKRDWDRRTVYLERVPHAHWSVCGIATFVDSLLAYVSSESPSSRSDDDIRATRVQHVSLPPHHLDQPGSIARCKGFALVTLPSEHEAEILTDTWPWESTEPSDNDVGKPEHDGGPIRDARTSGMRTMSKLEYDKRKQEYNSFREQLLSRAPSEPDFVPQAGPSQLSYLVHAPPAVPYQRMHERDVQHDSDVSEATFPLGCLLFVKNVHPQTNRTMLRTLLGKALLSRDRSADGIDYVDYTKGMDSCHIRVKASIHAPALITYFDARKLIQAGGNDAEGVHPQPGSSADTITVLLVTGRPEELYWAKVPEKVRMAAIQHSKVYHAGDAPSTPEPKATNPGIPSLDAHFPQGCLILVRNVHPKTNKSTLKALLGNVLVGRELAADGVDYVDYTKGMDACHVRVTGPEYSHALYLHFTESEIAHLGANDDRGGPPTAGESKPISVQLVDSTPEELYWEKVPEKIRREAVKRVRVAAGMHTDGAEERAAEVDVRRRKRKRQV